MYFIVMHISYIKYYALNNSHTFLNTVLNNESQ